MAFEYLLDEYLNDNHDIAETLSKINNDDNSIDSESNTEIDTKVVAAFLESPCPCSRNCQKLLNHQEVISIRAFFRSLEKKERNYILLSILKLERSSSDISMSGRTKKNRDRSKFAYRVSLDRPVCKIVFLFYYGSIQKG